MSTDTIPNTGTALALSGGGARGFAHIPVCEAFDRAGVRPAAIAGTSMGSVIGALYASGMSGATLRSEVTAMFAKATDVMGRMVTARRNRPGIFRFSFANPSPLDPKALLEAFLPDDLPPRIEDLGIPFAAVAVDFHSGEEIVFREGPLIAALAASIAFPPVMRPVEMNGHVLVDGGVANPLPHDVAGGEGLEVVASDVVLLPRVEPGKVPSPVLGLVGAAQILMQAVTRAKAASSPPALLVRPDVNDYAMFDFLKAEKIIATGDAAGAEVEQWLKLHALPERNL